MYTYVRINILVQTLTCLSLQEGTEMHAERFLRGLDFSQGKIAAFFSNAASLIRELGRGGHFLAHTNVLGTYVRRIARLRLGLHNCAIKRA